MSRRGKLSRDQKRKQKLADRAKQQASQFIEPYEGNKYKTEQYVEAIMKAEVGIYEAYVLTDRRLTDRKVRDALEYLVRDLRGEKPMPPADNPQTENDKGEPEDLIASRIKDNWRELFARSPRHSAADLVGILRTILGSIRVWSRPGPDSRGYLHYLEGFLGQMGVKVEALPSGKKSEEGEDRVISAEEERLARLGEAWVVARDAATKKEFFEAAHALLEKGQAGMVLDVCQGLLGKANDVGLQTELEEILHAAWKQEPPELAGPHGQQKDHTLKNWLHRVAPRWLRPFPRS
jgi:hypothetical protein